jgi:hypothetical protein
MATHKKFKQGLWIILILAVIACQRLTSKPNETKTVVPKMELPFQGRKRADFDFLKAGISYKEIVARVGKADRDTGFGSYIFEYDLADGSIMCIQFMMSLESIDSVYIIYADGKGENIIGP